MAETEGKTGDDTGGGDAVARKVILAVLRGNGVTVKKETGSYWLLVKGDAEEKRKLDRREYHRRFLHYLARVFVVPIHDFFHPEAHLDLVEEDTSPN